MSKRKGVLLLLVLALAVGSLLGCTSTAGPQEPKILRMALSSPPTTYNHHMSGISSDNAVLGYLVGRLYTYLPSLDGSSVVLAPELAAGPPIDVKGDGTVWHIPVDPEAKWANGEPINADTFMYSWKMLLDPVLVNTQGMGLARNQVEIVNAVDYFGQGPEGPLKWEDVGIKKVDEHTIELVLTTDFTATDVMRHLESHVKGPVYEPLYEQYMNASRTETQYGTDIDKIMSSGAFNLVTWVPGAEVKMEKNPHYKYADRVKLDGVSYNVVENAGTQIQMFENGEFDYIGLSASDIPTYSDDPRFRYTLSRAVRIIEMNHANPDKPILNNINFRRAFYYAIDRETIAKLASGVPAQYSVPTTSQAYADGTLFRTIADAEGYLPPNYGYDPDLAKELFDRAMKEEGLDKLELVMTYATTNSRAMITVEYIEDSLPKVFGTDRFKLALNAMPGAQVLDTMANSRDNPRAYELGISAWSFLKTDFNPAEIFEPFTSTYNRRNGPYNSDRLDALYLEAVSDPARKDEKRVTELAMEMEKVYFEEMIGIPVFQEAGGSLTAERLILPVTEPHNTAGWCMRFADIKDD